LTTPQDVALAIATDPQLASWRVRRQEAQWLELEAAPAAGMTWVTLAWPGAWHDPDQVQAHVRRAWSGNFALVAMGAAELPPELAAAGHDGADVSVENVPLSAAALTRCLQLRQRAQNARTAAGHTELELDRARHENQGLIAIGRALSSERDLVQLLGLILRRAREVTGADAGSMYVVEGLDEDLAHRTLRFMVSQNDSREVVSAAGFTMRVSSESIVGACVLSSDAINIPDLYDLDAPGSGNNPWAFVHDRTFDDKYRYQTRSMLTVPMISAREQVIGVIQLINKRAKGRFSLADAQDFEGGVVPFDEVSSAYARSLASQAGIALENALLYDEVKTLFEGFVRASVTAIEARDPTTSGHSERVANLTVSLAQAVDRVDAGALAPVRFSRDDLTVIEYAALLHDFGKVGVREHVLVKAKKLYPHQRDLVVERFRYIRRCLQHEALEKKVAYLLELSRDQALQQIMAADGDLAVRLAELDEFVQFVLSANEPTVLEQGGFERIAEIAAQTYLRDGERQPFLMNDEVQALQIRRGSLTSDERNEINSHVVHSYGFLKEIPWGRALRAVPEIAGAHHEKLDGTGYPGGLRGAEIPVPARMMTISDIYDALTASDRPYKRAMPPERALDVLRADVDKGALDAQLFEVFVGAEIWRQTGPLRRARRKTTRQG
jgi:HD-GYP domain-containing protein (c-di-GMP phosphodiesterase class II)